MSFERKFIAIENKIRDAVNEIYPLVINHFSAKNLENLKNATECAFDYGNEIGYLTGHEDGVRDSGYESGFAAGKKAGEEEVYKNNSLADIMGAAARNAYDKGYKDGEAGVSEVYYRNSGFCPTSLKQVEEQLIEARRIAYEDGYAAAERKVKENLMTLMSSALAAAKDSGYEQGFAEGTQEGHSFGYTDGHSDGFDKGHSAGYTKGLNDCFDNGYNDGLKDGFDKGHAAGYSAGIKDGFDNGYAVGDSDASTGVVGLHEDDDEDASAEGGCTHCWER